MKYLLIAVLVLVVVIYAFFVEPNLVKTTKIEISSEKIHEDFNGYTIAHISDLHIHANGLRESQLIAAIQAVQPDLLIITGDFVENVESIPAFDVFLTRLRERYSGLAIATTGNWEFQLNDIPEIEKTLSSHNIQLLRNEPYVIEGPNSFITIACVDDPSTNSDNIDSYVYRLDFQQFILLAAHSPDIVEKLGNFRFDLIIAGHTHGGQVFIPYISSKIASTKTQYIRGMYQTENGKLYVNRGIGLTKIPIRLFTPPEVAVFTLTSP